MDEARRERRRRGRALARLVAALRSEDAETRRAAAVTLGQLRDLHAIQPLVEAMEDHWSDVSDGARLSVVTALGQIGHPSAIPALVEAVEGYDEAVSRAAGDALLAMEGPIVPAVIEALVGEPARYQYPRRFPGLRRRIALVTLLERLDDPAAVGPLVMCLKEQDADLVRAAAEALGTLATRHPVPELRAALPPLERLVRQNWSVFLFRRVIRQIEAATAAIKDLPVPAVRSVIEPDGLPVPASAPEHAVVPDGGRAASNSWHESMQRLLQSWNRRDN